MIVRLMRLRFVFGIMLVNFELLFWVWVIDEVEDEEGLVLLSLMLVKWVLCLRDKMMSDSL